MPAFTNWFDAIKYAVSTGAGIFTTNSLGNPAGEVTMTVGEDFANPAASIVLSETLANVGEFDVSQYSILTVQLKPVGEALDQLTVSFKNHPDANYEVFYDEATDWTSPDDEYMISSTEGVDPTTLADGAECLFELRVAGYHSVKIEAAEAAATGGVLNIYARGE